MIKENWPKVKSKKIILTEAATEIEHYIAKNRIIKGYLRRNGFENIQSVPDAIVSRARAHWEHLDADALLAIACGPDECEQDPIACLEFARALKREAAKK